MSWIIAAAVFLFLLGMFVGTVISTFGGSDD